MAAYFFASPVDVDVRLEGEDDRKKVEIKAEKEKMISCPVYYDGESVAGQVCSESRARVSRSRNPRLSLRAFQCDSDGAQVTVRIRDGKKLAHEGIKVEFVGSIGMHLHLFSGVQY